MKVLLSFFVSVLVVTTCFAQARKENRSFFKLYVLNDKQEVLLIKFEGAWEIPGASYSMNQSISAFLDTVALQHGIEIKDKRLAGQITFHHEGRENPVIMHYYACRFKAGRLVTPRWGDDVRWVPLSQAYRLIPYPEMNAILKQINKRNHQVWGGAFKITYDTTSSTRKRVGYEVMEDFYRLN